ncbi:hypothetical protein [Chryseolinea lacunae]|uniref:SdiA-regulated family protein n=1 Tax=Chryseolinea lacunae TaxID=2801331 RepID=A0ABS1L168_9BACT|nr:hypothetical protein [Chryseolinea lacunae]MBL0745325.1 hypothetical protein [Chryseolinea lacunae]
MKTTNTTRRMTWGMICLTLLFVGCTPVPLYDGPPGYNFEAPEKLIMRESLLEISGITFHHGNADTVLAINDEDGKLFYFPIREKKAYSTRFFKGGDFEDVAVFKNQIYTLRSDGTVFSFADSIDRKKSEAKKWDAAFPEGEYESLFVQEPANKLITLCKKCESGKHQIQGYSLDLSDTTLTNLQPFGIDLDGLPSLEKKIKKAFQPSALAQSPITHEWFIISSVHKTLLVTDASWKPLASYALDPHYFNQPEGIAFDDAGHLYISNEGNEIQNGNIMKIAYTGQTAH